MKIVHLLLGKANPERSNGVNRAVDGLARAQRAAGAQVEVWGITPTPQAQTTARDYPLRLFGTAAHPFRLVRELRLALAALDAHARVHFHGGYHPEFHAAARILARGGRGWVVTPHGAFRTAVVRAAWLKKRAWLALFETRLLERARAVQVFSPREADELRRYAPRARSVILPNGLDASELGDATAVGSDPAHLVFGFLGRLDAHTKGLDLLLDGFARYAGAGGTGELSLVGAGPDESALRERASRAGIAGRVRFQGELFGPDKRAHLAAMDVFLHPSRHEGMPLAVLEAGGTGLPCILSRATNLAEIFERHGAGLVLDANIPQEIAQALARCEILARDGSLARMGRSARELVREEFDLQAIGARSLAELYGAGAPAASPAA
jgi:glycosyltransferase involved in cell wall biosynthesis